MEILRVVLELFGMFVFIVGLFFVALLMERTLDEDDFDE